MNYNSISECSSRPDESMIKVEEQNHFPLSTGQEKLKKLLTSINSKLDKLAQICSELDQLIDEPNIKNPSRDYIPFGEFSPLPLAQDVSMDPALNYHLSWLLDFLIKLYGFNAGGVFLLGNDKFGFKRLALSGEHPEKFEEMINSLWKKGDIIGAIDQKRRMIFPTQKEGSLLVLPFKVLDKKDGFWAAHFSQAFLLNRKARVDLFFWTELFISCIEVSYLRRNFSPFAQKEKISKIEAEKFFTTTQLAKATAHQINNFLQVILGRVQLLKMNKNRSANFSSDTTPLDTIEENANRACLILKDFSDHLHRGSDHKSGVGEVNIGHILKSDLNLLEEVLKGKKIQLKAKLGDDLPAVYGNPQELELALMCLIWGIEDRLPSGGSIVLQASIHQDSLCLDLSCAGKDNQPNEGLDLSSRETDSRFRLASLLLEHYHGMLRFRKETKGKMRFSIRFLLASEWQKESIKGSARAERSVSRFSSSSMRSNLMT